MNSMTLAAVTPTTPMTPLTPDSCYRSGEDTISIDDAQEVFASENDAKSEKTDAVASCSASNSDVTENIGSKHSTLVEVKVDIPVTKFCDIVNTGKDRSEKGREMNSKSDTCDTSDTKLTQPCDLLNSDTNVNITSRDVAPKHAPCSTDHVDSGTGQHIAPKVDVVQENEIISIYDSPSPSEENKSILVNLSSNQGEMCNPTEPRGQSEEPSPNVTPSSSLTNNDSGCIDLDGQMEGGGDGEINLGMREGGSSDVDDSTLIEEFESLSTDDQKVANNHKDSGIENREHCDRESETVEGKEELGAEGTVGLDRGTDESPQGMIDITAPHSPVRSLELKKQTKHSSEIK